MSRRNYLHGLLRDWANSIIEDASSNCYESRMTISKMMEYGADGASIRGIMGTSNYWPSDRIRQTSKAVESLPVKYRNVIIVIFLYRQSRYEASKTLKCDPHTINNRLNKAEIRLITTLNC